MVLAIRCYRRQTIVPITADPLQNLLPDAPRCLCLRNKSKKQRWCRCAEAKKLTCMSPHPFLPRSMLFEAFRLIDSDCLAGVKDLKLMC